MTMTVNPVAILPNGMKRRDRDDLWEGIISLTFGAADTYVTGGIPLSPGHFALDKIVTVWPALSTTGCYAFVWNPATQKLVVFSVAGTQLLNGSALLQNDTVVLQAVGY